MQNILVTGAKGQLAMELQRLVAKYPEWNFFFFSKEDLNISDPESITTTFSKIKPQYCINCAAYTAVDKAETNIEEAYSINATAVKLLASACADYNAKLIHISTDYVFDGSTTQPYKEEDETNPINVYGASKRQGEIEALNNNSQSIIIRTSWVYSFYGNNFVKTMLRLFQTRSEINVVSDQFGSPTYAADLAEAICSIISKDAHLPGIYHYSNEGIISWYEFASEIKKIIGSHCIIHPINSEQYPTAAKRPMFSVLDKQKIQNVFGIKLKPWQESLQKMLQNDSLQ
jgi:dTDP-4-dehydrorhamnose reductase